MRNISSLGLFYFEKQSFVYPFYSIYKYRTNSPTDEAPIYYLLEWFEDKNYENDLSTRNAKRQKRATHKNYSSFEQDKLIINLYF